MSMKGKGMGMDEGFLDSFFVSQYPILHLIVNNLINLPQTEFVLPVMVTDQ